MTEYAMNLCAARNRLVRKYLYAIPRKGRAKITGAKYAYLKKLTRYLIRVDGTL